MSEVILLGTGRALPTVGQENTYMALTAGQDVILIDCAGAPYRRLLAAGLDPEQLDHIILTHAHPDHTYGASALFMALWLAGRQRPLHLHGPAATCDLVQSVIELYHPEDWPGMYPLLYHPVGLTPGCSVLKTEHFDITASPVEHMLPAIGLRVVDRATGRVLVYSSDTAPGTAVRQLAQGAQLLIHEATGKVAGHSSAEEAGEVARDAHVGRLVLVHYDENETPPAQVEQAARSAYTGDVHAGRDFERFSW